MNLTFYKKDALESFTISPFVSNSEQPNRICVWLERQDGEGGQFSSTEIEDVIYEALNKFFKENH